MGDQMFRDTLKLCLLPVAHCTFLVIKTVDADPDARPTPACAIIVSSSSIAAPFPDA